MSTAPKPRVLAAALRECVSTSIRLEFPTVMQATTHAGNLREAGIECGRDRDHVIVSRVDFDLLAERPA